MKTQTKSRVLLLACVLVLAMVLTAVFAFSASAEDVTTKIDTYSVVLNDGVDIQVNGTVAAEDAEKTVTIEVIQRGTTVIPVTVDDKGAYTAVIEVPATKFGDLMQINLKVDDAVVDTKYASVKTYAATVLADENASAEMKTLVSDIIRYGAAVLAYDNAADEAAALVEGLELADAVEYECNPEIVANKGETEGKAVAITDVAMVLGGRINLVFTAADEIPAGATATAGVIEGNKITVSIPASKFLEPVSVALYDGETLLSNEVEYSPLAYGITLVQQMYTQAGGRDNLTDEQKKTEQVLMTLSQYVMSAHMATTHEEVVTVDVATCQATGTKTTTCAACGYEKVEELEKDPAVHSAITHAVADGKITYTCTGCEKFWTSEKMFIADGTNTNGLSSNDTNKGYNDGASTKPVITDGYYAFVKNNGTATQMQTYLVCSGAVSTPQMSRLGFASISLKAPEVSIGWGLQLINDTAGATWGHGVNGKGQMVLQGVADKPGVVKTAGGTEMALKAEGWTRIDISFVPTADDQIVLTYYVDGVAVAVESAAYALKDNTPIKMYISGNSVYDTTEGAAQPSAFFDDWMLAYADSSSTLFDSHTHVASTTLVKVDDNTHGYKCTGCDEIMNKEAHKYTWDESNAATCAQAGYKTGACDCGATTRVDQPVLAHTLTAQSITDKVVAYKCADCNKEYTMAAAAADDYSSDPSNWKPADYSTADVSSGALLLAGKTSGNNAQVSVKANSKTTSATDLIVGFDLKATATFNKDFVAQWKISNEWKFNDTKTKLTVKTDGSIIFNGVDTGFDVSTTEFTSIVLKAHLSNAETSATMTVSAWVNGQYVGEGSVTVEDYTKSDGTFVKIGGNATFQNSNSYVQLCVPAHASGNQMYYDNVYVADVPAGAEGTVLIDYLTAK